VDGVDAVNGRDDDGDQNGGECLILMQLDNDLFLLPLHSSLIRIFLSRSRTFG